VDGTVAWPTGGLSWYVILSCCFPSVGTQFSWHCECNYVQEARERSLQLCRELALTVSVCITSIFFLLFVMSSLGTPSLIC
jgi:hypothetical protein